jgi:7-carboxy-7-deazaguanine synthase
LTQSEFLARFLGAVRPSVPVLLETNGVLPRRLAEVLPLVDIISMDIKPPSNTGEAGFWDEHSEFIGLARTKELYVKVLVDQETLAEEVGRAAEMVASFSPEASLFLQPIVDACGRIAIDAEQLTNLFLVARRYLTTVRVLPQTHKQLGIR